MSRIFISGFGLVTAVAATKTYLVWNFAMADAAANWTRVSALFALFFALTALVAYFSFIQIGRYVEQQRQSKLAPGAGEPVAKETVILRYAPEWGLSQAQADVAIFVAKGFSNGEIAEMRGCAIATVKSQLGAIYQKSGLISRYQLIAFVTDEVCAMVNGPSNESGKLNTKDALPLVGRLSSAS